MKRLRLKLSSVKAPPIFQLGIKRISRLGYLLILMLADPLFTNAGTLDVTSSAAYDGNYGLRVNVGSSCSGPAELGLHDQTISGPAVHEACRTILSSATDIVPPEQVTFRAGERIVLDEGFAVLSGARFEASIESHLVPEAWLEDRSPRAERRYAAGFFVRLDNLVLGDSDHLDLFTGRAADGSSWLWITAMKNVLLDETRLVVRARRNDGSFATTEGVSEVAAPTGWTWISLDWKSAQPDAEDGYLHLYVGSVLFATLTPLSNSNGRIDTVRLGADSVSAGVSGSFDLDAYRSRRAGPVVPPN